MCEGDGAAAWQTLVEGSIPHVRYSSSADLHSSIMSLEQAFVSAIPQTRIHDELVYRFWFPRETASIRVVCPQIHDPGEFAHRSSPDYTYLDNLGDTDALLELTVFLSQCYPRASIDQFSSDDLPDGHTGGNLVVIGGPGSAEISNDICRQMMSMVKSSVAYSDGCEEMTIRQDGTSVERRAQYGTRKSTRNVVTGSIAKKGWFTGLKCLIRSPVPAELERDWGYFARFPNPLNENATVVLVNGIHTAGVVGAARAFSDRRETLRNYQSVYQSGVDVARFECFFEVPVLNGESSVPEIDPPNVRPLGPVAESDGTLPRRSPAERRESVRVLFIAGDRGGSQVNQIQLPNEFHSIQEALRSSRHREVIGMTNPILAATRERLARAYLERPTILHFAGHGNDRCLAIIKDEHLIANTVLLDLVQLCEMIDTMEQRVRLCILNACISRELAHQIVRQEYCRLCSWMVWKGRGFASHRFCDRTLRGDRRRSDPGGLCQRGEGCVRTQQ